MMFWRRLPLFHRDVLTPYLAHLLLVFLAGYFAVVFFPGNYDPREITNIVTQGLNRWDSGWYLQIVRDGYDTRSAAFFPLYPLLIHLCARLGVDPVMAGIAISNLALWGLLAVFFLLAGMDTDMSSAQRATWYLALFPTAFYLSAIYTESLYLFLVLLAFYFARRSWWLPAGAAGMLASATRNMGIFLSLALLLEYLTARSGKIKKDICFLGLIPLGAILFMAYLKIRLGDPLAFLHAQQHWDRHFDWPWITFKQTMIYIGHNYNFFHNLLDLSFTFYGVALFLLSLFKGWRLRPSYGFFVLTGLLVPLLSPATHEPLFSMPRFVMVLFPLYLILARLTTGEREYNFVLALLAPLYFFLHFIFARGEWVA